MMTRAQMQSMEAIMIVIVLVLLVMIGFFFYSSASKGVVDREKIVAQRIRAETLAEKLRSIEELSCPNYGAEQTPCIDRIKANIFSERMKKPQYRLQYHTLFGEANVTLITIYPKPSSPGVGVIQLYDGIPNGSVSVITRSVPVAIFNASTGDREFGLLVTEAQQ